MGGVPASANSAPDMPIPYLACMAAAASFYALPPRVLPAIQQVEGGRIGTVAADSDGTSDLGVMQVNTRWLAPLAGITRLTEAEVRARLILDPCFNIAAAAAILRTYRAEFAWRPDGRDRRLPLAHTRTQPRLSAGRGAGGRAAVRRIGPPP